jgi:arylsulfatase A-like enzyme
VAIITAVLCAIPLPASAAEPSPRPNIVIFYIDDVGPHDGRLWNDPTRTPNLHRYFVDQGIEFSNAIVEDPLCCPARGNLLTGLHTHNNGLVANDARMFDPSVHVGRSLKGVGYQTMFIGKYLNNNWRLTEGQWLEHDAGWNVLDVFRGVNGYFYNYVLHTREGDTPVIANYHSTQMIGDRAIARMRATPADKPLFAVLSIYNLHGPNTPMPQFDESPKCADIGNWKPPNYNESDVSDKPLAIRRLPMQPYASGWPMQGYCEEMLGIDKVVGQVTDELRAEGRLDNTLLIFTGDNGIGWGQHRMGQQKRMPYTTPVPLFMRWPARWGTDGGRIAEHVSNIDLAPTFCALGGCTIGPFPTGHTGPDGINMLPLIDGDVGSLGRDALLETEMDPESEANGIGGLPWTALRTTALSPHGLWHYVEYSNGERELYDLADDPWELQNRAGAPALAELQSALADRLAALRLEGRPHGVVVGRPDAAIALSTAGPFQKIHTYFSSVNSQQTVKRSGVLKGSTYEYQVHVGNDAPTADSISVLGNSVGSSKLRVSYWIEGTEVTAQVRAGTQLVALGPGESIRVVVRVRVANSGVPLGTQSRTTVTVRSMSDRTKVDVVRAVTTR